MTVLGAHAVRLPAVAGTFYPEEASVLAREIDDLLARAESPQPSGTILALVSPHAGYVYSGFTAAHAYRLLRGSGVETVVLIGPSHREYFEGISVFPGAAYRTPLGDVPVNTVIRERLLSRGVLAAAVGHRAEHALEVQLPFLQRAMEHFSIVPLVMGSQRREYCRELGTAIGDVLRDQNAVVVASSDLSHYHPYDEAVRLDRRVADLVEAYDTDGLMDRLEEETVEACGGGPIVAAMLAAGILGANRARVLHHCNSGDVTGDRGAVVGYLAAAMVREG